MNKLLVVVPYKLWFLQYQRFTRLANSCSREYIPGIVFNLIGCGVGGVLVNDGRT